MREAIIETGYFSLLRHVKDVTDITTKPILVPSDFVRASAKPYPIIEMGGDGTISSAICKAGLWILSLSRSKPILNVGVPNYGKGFSEVSYGDVIHLTLKIKDMPRVGYVIVMFKDLLNDRPQQGTRSQAIDDKTYLQEVTQRVTDPSRFMGFFDAEKL